VFRIWGYYCWKDDRIGQLVNFENNFGLTDVCLVVEPRMAGIPLAGGLGYCVLR
jgi:hypothetical protein